MAGCRLQIEGYSSNVAFLEYFCIYSHLFGDEFMEG